jgi:probable HAF family extracellular repeat protein
MTWIVRMIAGGGRLRLVLAAAALLAVLAMGKGTPAPEGSAPELALSGARTTTESRGPAPRFVLERGRFTTVAIPAELRATTPVGVAPVGNNDRGQIVGEYEDDRGVGHGFLLDRGRFTRIDVPGAKATNAAKINNRSQVVGSYSDVDTDLEATGVRLRGFLLDRGRYVRLDYPGALSSQAMGINDKGQIVGEYQGPDGTYHGYLWEQGRFRAIAAGSATAINNRGQITGVTGPVDAMDGYVLDQGRLTTFDAPGAKLTAPFGINDQGQVVGISDSKLTGATISGFLREREKFTAIVRPGASLNFVGGINNRGQIVGAAGNPEDLASQQPAAAPMGMADPPGSAG